MRSSEGTGAAFSKGIKRDSSKMAAGTLEFRPAIRTGGRTAARACKPSVLVLRTVKSFTVLSVRERSSGNSEATMPHNRRQTSDATRIFRILVLASIDFQRLHQVIRLSPIIINVNRLLDEPTSRSCGPVA